MLTTLLASVIVASGPTLNLKVDGDGYLRFARDGRVAYAKSSTLQVSQGRLGLASGAVLLPSVTVPPDAGSLDADLEGNIFAVSARGKCAIGRIVLALFPDSTALSPDGGLLISESRPTLGNPGEGTNGVIRVGGQPQTVATTGGSSQTTKATPKIEPSGSQIHGIQGAPKTPTPGVAVRPGPVRIDVQAASEIEGDQMLLGDVAQIVADPATQAKLASVSVGVTPPIGVRLTVDLRRITSSLREAHVDPTDFAINVPQGATAIRKSSHVTQQEFIDCAIAFAKTQAEQGMDFACRDQYTDFLAPVGKVELKVEQYSPTVNGNAASVIVAVYVDGRRVNSRTVRIEMTGINGKPLIRVPAGTRVKIVFSCNGAVVEVTGRTMGAGVVGQPVEVETEDRSRHTGTLTGPTAVEVKL